MTERSIFIAALEFDDSTEQAAYVAEACGSDAGLRRRVEKLLRSHGEVGNFMEQPANPEAPGPTSSQSAIRNLQSEIVESPGAIIGRYKLLEQIGEGGMGVVFMAEQLEPVRRKVALKIVKPGMDSRQVIARFEAERQALALMEHPNIAKVLDAGTTGEPSRVSDRVSGDGEPRRLTPLGSPRPYFVMELVKGVPITQFCDENHLSPRQRLELFVVVCQAVQHAHQKGIIHRDLKPSNIMVALYDSQPVPKIIDFGVAKALHERLTERTMFTGYGQIVGTFEYMSPEQAQLNALDIDTRSDTYALGVLLYELLTGTTPIEKKRLRRTPFDEVLRIIREEEPPKPSTRLSQTRSAPRGVPREQSDLTSTLRALRFEELDWIVMKALDKDRSRRYDSASSLALDIQRYLRDEPVEACPPTVRYRLRKFASKHKKLLATAAAFAALLLIAGVVSVWQAVRATLAYDAARSAEEQIRLERDRAVAAEKEAKVAAAQTLAINDFLKNQLLVVARPKGEAGGLGKDVTMKEALDEAAPKIDKVFADQPVLAADVHFTFGQTYAFLGRYAEARRHYEMSLELRREVLGPEHRDTLCVENALASNFLAQGQRVEALALCQRTLEARLRVLGTDHRETLQSQNILGLVFRAEGKFEEAEKLFRKTLETQLRILGEEDDDTLASQNNLAAVLRAGRRFEEAEDLFRKTLKVRQRLYGPDHPETLATHTNLGVLLTNLGRHAEAEAIFRQVSSAMEVVHGPDHSHTLAAMRSLGLSLRDQNQWSAAAEVLREVLARRRKALPKDDRKLGEAMADLGRVLLSDGKPQEAEPLFREALATHQRALSEGHWQIALDQGQLGATLIVLQNYDEAELLLLASYRDLKAQEPSVHSSVKTWIPYVHQRLVELYDAWGKPDQAAEWRKKLEAAGKE
ncbi:MAG: serine/threonine protein kinase [Planctomycetes bacterium]|nr:serine/threonine protein kinase [Planctomycetota bacterium]